jgi:hypothetical protein
MKLLTEKLNNRRDIDFEVELPTFCAQMRSVNFDEKL